MPWSALLRAPRDRRHRRLLAAAAFAALLGVAGVHAQFGGGGGAFTGGISAAGWAGGRHQREMLPAQRGGVYGCWFVFDRVASSWGKRGWDTDYPLAVRNYMTRLGDFTTATINKYPDGAMADGVVTATDPNLYMCPMLFASDAGTARFSAAEAAGLRDYLLKGGTLWVDDFWGREAMESWLWELARVLPEFERTVLDSTHPLMSTFYFIDEVPQMPSIQSWLRNGGETWERRGTDSQTPTLSAILDDHGRALVVMTHNTDIGDGMEREGVDPNYFYLFSPKAYSLAINIALYAMTH